MRRGGLHARGPQAARGFTLVEVLVALGIVAIALMAGLKASAALSRNAQRQADALLGQLCAENALIALRLARQMPGVGDADSSCEQAGQTLQLRTLVRLTPNPNFLRVDVQALRADEPVARLTTVMGRN